MADQVKLSDKQRERVLRAQRSVDEARMLLETRAETLTAIVEMIDEQYGTNLIGHEHVINDDGYIIASAQKTEPQQ